MLRMLSADANATLKFKKLRRKLRRSVYQTSEPLGRQPGMRMGESNMWIMVIDGATLSK